jgi:transcriptional regulator with GAF, ATPase, and Fis domain
VRRREGHRSLALVDGPAERAQELAHGANVRELRHVLERGGAARQQRSDQQRKRGILGAADRNLAREARAAFDDDLVHRSLRV